MKDSSSSFHRSTNKTLVVATHNDNKFEEIAKALEGLNLNLQPLKHFPEIPEAPETGKSFLENARQKAMFYADLLPNYAVLAEDSGLVIPSLGGYPGIHSARIAKEDTARTQTVLRHLQDAGNESASSRFAYYICCMCFLWNQKDWTIEERCEGNIVDPPRGQSGFGYDPIFAPTGSDKTFGEMSMQQKSQYSHRAKAASKLIPILQTEFL